jgi:glycosyltransferase involved in cell wall biosynthesis
MAVVFFPKGDRSVPSSRYRCFLFAEELARLGIETRIVPAALRAGLRPRRGLWRDLVRLHRELMSVPRGDTIYLQRPIQSTPFVGLIAVHRALRPRRLIFDYCDPIFLHSPRKTRLLCRLADHVVSSCEDLAAYARQYNSRVHVIPNSVPDREIAREPPTGSGTPPVFGWVGSARLHRSNLRLLFSGLRRVERPIVLRIIGAEGEEDLFAELADAPNVELDLVGWLDRDQVPAAIAGFDAALLPVEDTPWNRKLLTKMIEYLAVGLPVVASPVGENRRAIRDGFNGFLVSSPAEWGAAIDRLAASPAMRRELAANALTTARDRYSLGRNVRQLAALLGARSDGASRAMPNEAG